MKPVHVASAVLTAGIALSCAVLQTYADGEKVQFPQDYAGGVHYATINHGNIREELFTSQAAIALKSVQPMPSGTVFTMEDYRANALCRYVVMESAPAGARTIRRSCARANGNSNGSTPIRR